MFYDHDLSINWEELPDPGSVLSPAQNYLTPPHHHTHCLQSELSPGTPQYTDTHHTHTYNFTSAASVLYIAFSNTTSAVRIWAANCLQRIMKSFSGNLPCRLSKDQFSVDLNNFCKNQFWNNINSIHNSFHPFSIENEATNIHLELSVNLLVIDINQIDSPNWLVKTAWNKPKNANC